MFHLVSQVAAGDVTDERSFEAWYSRTLDKLQRERRGLKQTTFDESAQDLDKTGCAEYDKLKKTIKIKPLGRVCARYYFSPYDVRDWFMNISSLVKKGLLESDTCQEWMIANVSSASSWESDDVRKCCHPYTEAVTDYGLFMHHNISVRLLSVHHALSKTMPACELPELFSIKNDLPRMLAALKVICKCATKIWGNISWFIDKIELRFKYGVNTCLTDLVSLDGIGKSSARELYDKFEISNEAELRQRLDDVLERGSPALKRAAKRALDHENNDKIENQTGDET
jgi:replicative superfamily II helicase